MDKVRDISIERRRIEYIIIEGYMEVLAGNRTCEEFGKNMNKTNIKSMLNGNRERNG